MSGEEKCLLDSQRTAGSNGVPPQWHRARFRLTAEEVAAELARRSLSEDQLLCELTAPMRLLARPPISGFRVGAVALGATGRLYVGVNLEFPGLPLHHSVHAEQFLIANAVQAGESALTRLAVSAVPCGHCRQFCSELACADDLVFLLNDGKHYTLAELLPVRFRPSDLLDDFALNFERVLPEAFAALKARSSEACLQSAASAAVKAACGCYAPYTQSTSGAAIITSTGKVFSGGYMESAAFNPSLPPLQAALVDAVIGGLRDFAQVTEVVLVERADARVSQAAATRLMLAAIASSARFTLLLADGG